MPPPDGAELFSTVLDSSVTMPPSSKMPPPRFGLLFPDTSIALSVTRLLGRMQMPPPTAGKKGQSVPPSLFGLDPPVMVTPLIVTVRACPMLITEPGEPSVMMVAPAPAPDSVTFLTTYSGPSGYVPAAITIFALFGAAASAAPIVV